VLFKTRAETSGASPHLLLRQATAFAGAPTAGFQVADVKVPGDSALVGFGLATAVFANTGLYVHYDGNLAGGASSNAIAAGVRFSW
jgi:uncharacterized protein with beta-barrel porin domain